MDFNQTKKNYLYEDVVKRLEKDILDGSFADNKLPTEAELCELYSVSRTVIREAFKILSERHLIISIVGSGAYITKPNANDLSAIMERLVRTHDITIDEIVAVRIIIETNAASLAALNATEDELNEMEAISSKLADMSIPFDERTELDCRFHEMMCRASHNQMLSLVAAAIAYLTERVINETIIKFLHNPDLSNRGSHSRIVTVLRKRDPLAAHSIVYEHLYMSKTLIEA